ncbi:hypothetical protein G8D25_05125 (plasmid) [Ralstonia solanacearum]|uniref:hypothetical protein n=1 Tax=Ralstonia solanacearum TaxID=305 RepID=UPI0012D4803B|nr:hypothetical protein [Ralstonia solanacearum]QJC23581.1 hypothetical protein G8D25_05125 [Ralstonia solanacearum]
MSAALGAIGFLLSCPGFALAQMTPSRSAAAVNAEQEQRLRQQQAREREQVLQALTIRA